MTERADNAPVGLNCPGCGEAPYAVLGGGTQAFCGNVTGCNMLIWDPTLTLEETLAAAQPIDLSGGAP